MSCCPPLLHEALRLRAAPQRAGFTLVELMVVVAIAAVLAALAAPGFHGLIQRHRVRAATHDLTSALYFARTEAVRRGGRVSLAARPAVGDCDASAGDDWHCGWQVFADADQDGRFEPDQGDILLRSAPAHPTLEVRIRGRHTVVFNRWGGFNGAGIAGFGVRPAARHDAGVAQALCISSGGRIRAVAGAFTCS